MKSRFLSTILAALTAAVTGGAASSALAFPDATPSARVDAEIRPNFGYLLRPALRRHHYERCRYRLRSCRGYGGYAGGYYPGGGYPGGAPYPPDQGYPGGYPPGGGYPPLQETVRVDCSLAQQPGFNPLQDALQRVIPGGVIYVRAGGTACNESLYITQPVTIVGEGIPAFATGPNPQPAALAPPQGRPAILIDEGVKGVEIRDLVIECRQARDSACIESYNADVALTRVQLRYQGNASAIYASGGRVLMRESDITANTFDPAIVADGVMTQISDSVIRGESVGLDITLGGQSESLISNVGVLGIPSTDPTGRPEFGIMVHGAREAASALTIDNTTVRGWRTGMWIGRGATVAISHVRVSRAVVGIASGGEVKISQSLIGGGDSGVYIFGGRAELHGVVVHEFTRKPLFAENGAVIDDADVWIFAPACGGEYAHSHWNCRSAGQLPPGYRDDVMVEHGPWGWSDEGYRTIGAPPPPRHHGWFGRRRY